MPWFELELVFGEESNATHNFHRCGQMFFPMEHCARCDIISAVISLQRDYQPLLLASPPHVRVEAPCLQCPIRCRFTACLLRSRISARQHRRVSPWKRAGRKMRAGLLGSERGESTVDWGRLLLGVLSPVLFFLILWLLCFSSCLVNLYRVLRSTLAAK